MAKNQKDTMDEAIEAAAGFLDKLPQDKLNAYADWWQRAGAKVFLAHLKAASLLLAEGTLMGVAPTKLDDFLHAQGICFGYRALEQWPMAVEEQVKDRKTRADSQEQEENPQ